MDSALSCICVDLLNHAPPFLLQQHIISVPYLNAYSSIFFPAMARIREILLLFLLLLFFLNSITATRVKTILPTLPQKAPKKFKFPYQGQASSIILFPFHSSNISIWFEAPCSIRRESPPSLVKWRCYLYCKNGLQYVRTQIMSRPAHVYMWIHFIMYFFF